MLMLLCLYILYSHVSMDMRCPYSFEIKQNKIKIDKKTAETVKTEMKCTSTKIYMKK